LLDQKKVTKEKIKKLAKATPNSYEFLDRKTKAKMPPRFRHFLTLLFSFAAPIHFSMKINS
jgi:hypothetical protein